MIRTKLSIEEIKEVDLIINEKGWKADFYDFIDRCNIKENEITFTDYLMYLLDFIPERNTTINTDMRGFVFIEDLSFDDGFKVNKKVFINLEDISSISVPDHISIGVHIAIQYPKVSTIKMKNGDSYTISEKQCIEITHKQ